MWRSDLYASLNRRRFICKTVGSAYNRNMLTKKDVEMLMEVFPTKGEVELIVEKTVERVFDEKFDQKFDEKFDQKFEEKMAPFRKEMVEGFDTIISMIEKQNLPNAARDAQLARHDGWIHQIAEESDIKLRS